MAVLLRFRRWVRAAAPTRAGRAGRVRACLLLTLLAVAPVACTGPGLEPPGEPSVFDSPRVMDPGAVPISEPNNQGPANQPPQTQNPSAGGVAPPEQMQDPTAQPGTMTPEPTQPAPDGAGSFDAGVADDAGEAYDATVDGAAGDEAIKG